ncbi:hypothetical protein D3C87_1911640 [compost metagenome]
MGQSTAGLIDARGAGAQNHTDTVAAVGLDRLVNLFANLQRGFQQQLVVAGVLLFQLNRDRWQFTAHRRHRQGALRYPAGLGAQA